MTATNSYQRGRQSAGQHEPTVTGLSVTARTQTSLMRFKSTSILPLQRAKGIVDAEGVIANGTTYECATRLRNELEGCGNVVAVTEVKS